MRSFCRKSLSLILSLVLVLSVTLICVPSSAAEETPGTDFPLIYVTGQGSPLVIYEDGVKREAYPVKYDIDEIMQIAKDNIDVFAKAVVTQKWTDFGNLVRDVVSSMFSEIKLDENGESLNGVKSGYEYSRSSLGKIKKTNGKYKTTAFKFDYDWRLDPYKNAETLHQYIEDVLAVTGYDHVALSGRCEGACVTAAYMDKYDCEYVTDYIEYSTAVNGVTVLSKCFAGDIYLDADSVERFVYDLNLSIEEPVKELIQAFVTVFNRTNGLDLACWAVNNVWEDIYLDIMPQTLIETFGTWPGFWSMVKDEDYNRAKNNVFHNADMDKWAGFIDIIDNYHYNVQVKAYDNLKKYAERGIDVYNITKYGYQTIPISADGTVLTDGYVPVTDGSYGATTATLLTVFDNDYLAAAEMNGASGFISPDKQIDASTCLFPERTWFVKNLPHKSFPSDPNRLIDAMVNGESFTVDSSEEFPQFLVYENEKLIPMSEENMDTTQRYEHTFFEALKNLMNALFTVIKNYISKAK